MNTQIYYFSGTGNSLHIARELQKRLGNTDLIPMVGAMNSNKLATKADAVGFIFPIHCLGIPIFVKNILHAINLQSASYLFAVASRECSAKVFSEINRSISRQGKKLDACFSVQMPETYLPVFEVDNEYEIAEKETRMLKQLDSIQSIISNRERYEKPDPKTFAMFLYYILRPVVMFIFSKTGYFRLGNRFYADAKCSGCGICSRICPADRIEMRGDRPTWNRKIQCMYCFACLHYCPQQAVQIKKSKTPVRGRYHHPEVSAEEIIMQRNGP